MESKNFDYKKLNTILQNKNISVEQLAKMTGKTTRAVRPWLNGTSTPHKSTLKKIIEVLHISEESISKTGVSIRNKEYEVITETLDFLFDYYLPLFAYYTRSNEGYQLNKNIDKLNKLNSIHSDSIRYRSNKELYKNKTSLELMKYLIEVTVPENSIILDFFAGSGTTAQAVIEAGGNRKFILATNNENNIASEITHARLLKLSEGTDFYVPQNFNLKYFKTDFVDKSQLSFYISEHLIYFTKNVVKNVVIRLIFIAIH